MSLFARLFGRSPAPERKASRVGPAISLGYVGLAKWPSRNYEKLSKEGYQQNVVVYACVRKIATAAANVPLLAYREMAGGKLDEVPSSKMLALLRRPNPMMPDGAFWLASLYSYQLLAGNAYVEQVSGASGAPIELHLWRPDRTKVVPGPLGYPMGYEYNVNGVIKRVDVDFDRGIMPVLHLREFHPLDDFYGMPALDPGAFSVDLHTDATRWNRSLLTNAGRPPGAFVYTPADPKVMDNTLTEPQRAQLEEDIDRKFSGPSNAGRPLVLDGGLDWKPMGIDPVDMDYVNGRADAARDIARAFGVPPMLLGIPGDNTYSNYQEANRDFHESTVLPLVDRVARAFTGWLGPAFGEESIRLGYDADELPALAPRRAERWKQVQDADFLTIDEKREALGYEAYKTQPDSPGAQLLVSSTMVPLEDAGVSLRGGPEPDDNEAAAPGDEGGAPADDEDEAAAGDPASRQARGSGREGARR